MTFTSGFSMEIGILAVTNSPSGRLSVPLVDDEIGVEEYSTTIPAKTHLYDEVWADQLLNTNVTHQDASISFEEWSVNDGPIETPK